MARRRRYRRTSTRSAPVATNDKSLHLRFHRARRAPRIGKRLWTSIKRTMGYPCHIHSTLQLGVASDANSTSPYTIYESQICALDELRKIYSYGYQRSYLQNFTTPSSEGVGPYLTKYSEYKLKLDCVSENYTLFNPTAGRVQVIAYEYVPRQDLPTLYAWYNNANTGSLYGAMVNASTNVAVNPDSTDFPSNNPNTDILSNDLSSKRMTVLKNFFRLVRKRRFGIDAGQEVKYSMSYTPKRLLTGPDLHPDLFNQSNPPALGNATGIWLFKGLSRVVWFQIYGDLVSNVETVNTTRYAAVDCVIKETVNYHFVAPQVTNMINYTEYASDTMRSAAATSTRVMPTTSRYVQKIIPLQT